MLEIVQNLCESLKEINERLLIDVIWTEKTRKEKNTKTDEVKGMQETLREHSPERWDRKVVNRDEIGWFLEHTCN